MFAPPPPPPLIVCLGTNCPRNRKKDLCCCVYTKRCFCPEISTVLPKFTSNLNVETREQTFDLCSLQGYIFKTKEFKSLNGLNSPSPTAEDRKHYFEERGEKKNKQERKRERERVTFCFKFIHFTPDLFTLFAKAIELILFSLCYVLSRNNKKPTSFFAANKITNPNQKTPCAETDRSSF